MNKKPIVGKENNENKFKALLESIPSEIKFLPVLIKQNFHMLLLIKRIFLIHIIL